MFGAGPSLFPKGGAGRGDEVAFIGIPLCPLVPRGEREKVFGGSVMRPRPGINLDIVSQRWHFGVAMEKLEQLRALLGAYDSCLVAYSGGVDSVFLAYMAREVLG